MAQRHDVLLRDRVEERLSEKGVNVSELSRELGLPVTTLYRWRSEACKVGQVTPLEKSDERFTSQEKQRILRTAAELAEHELGAFLRKEGVSESQLERWREQVDAALARPSRSRKVATKEREQSRKIRLLERELRRKDKALAEASALLILKKKAQEIWGDDEDDDTTEESD